MRHQKDVRQEVRATLSADFNAGCEERPKLSRRNNFARAMDYLLKQLAGLHPLSRRPPVLHPQNASELGLCGIALGRKSWLFAGSDRRGERAATMYSLIVTAKLNDVDPQVSLADYPRRIAEQPAHRTDDLSRGIGSCAWLHAIRRH